MKIEKNKLKIKEIQIIKLENTIYRLKSEMNELKKDLINAEEEIYNFNYKK